MLVVHHRLDHAVPAEFVVSLHGSVVQRPLR